MTRRYLARSSLLLQRLGEIAVANFQLLEQPHVLDGDYRLISEGLQEVDLLIGDEIWRYSCDVSITPIA